MIPTKEASMAEFAESRRRLLATAWIASASSFLGTGGVGVGLAAEKGTTRGEEKARSRI
jgi:hypothetical protein